MSTARITALAALVTLAACTNPFGSTPGTEAIVVKNRMGAPAQVTVCPGRLRCSSLSRGFLFKADSIPAGASERQRVVPPIEGHEELAVVATPYPLFSGTLRRRIPRQGPVQVIVVTADSIRIEK